MTENGIGVPHAAVDLETMATHERAAVVAIAAVIFDPTATDWILGETFSAAITLDSCLRAGLEVDGKTVEWWMGQSGEARAALLYGQPLAKALAAFNRWLGERGAREVRVWSHATFDLPILTAAYRAVRMPVPWAHRNARDIRTIVDLPAAGEQHVALNDARRMAWMVQASYRRMRTGR